MQFGFTLTIEFSRLTLGYTSRYINTCSCFLFLAAYLNKAIITIAQRHNRSAKPPVIKPIRVFVIHPSLAVFLLFFSTGSCPSLGNGGEMLYSVDFSSVEETDGGSAVFHTVEGNGDGEDVFSGA